MAEAGAQFHHLERRARLLQVAPDIMSNRQDSKKVDREPPPSTKDGDVRPGVGRFLHFGGERFDVDATRFILPDKPFDRGLPEISPEIHVGADPKEVRFLHLVY